MQAVVFHLGVIVLFLVVMGEASLSKIIARETPEWFIDQFKDSWLGKLAPLPLMFWSIAIAELAITVCFVLALVMGEFTAGSANTFTEWGCLGAMFLFSGLCFGLRVTFDFQGAANSFFYSALSGVLWFVITKLP